jgi:hypothetical protein
MYENQMEMFNRGGVSLKDEGGEIENTSGNDVPLGGTKEGVADDQPANLSAGEMVLSADVVRYHGVERIMALRDEAKIGYSKMKAMGQLGNEEDATIPTEAIFNPGGMPFSVVDLEYIDMEDDVDVAEGTDESASSNSTSIKAQAGTLVPTDVPPTQVFSVNPVTGLPETTTAPAGSIPQVLQPAPTPTITQSVPSTLSQISQPSTTLPTQPAPVTPLPGIGEFMGGVQGVNNFQNELGQVIQIPVINGQQIYDTPVGFQPFDPANPQPFVPTTPDAEGPTEEPPATVEQRRIGGPSATGPGSFAAGVQANVEAAALALQGAESVGEAAAMMSDANSGTFATDPDAFNSATAIEAAETHSGTQSIVGEYVGQLFPDHSVRTRNAWNLAAAVRNSDTEGAGPVMQFQGMDPAAVDGGSTQGIATDSGWGGIGALGAPGTQPGTSAGIAPAGLPGMGQTASGAAGPTGPAPAPAPTPAGLPGMGQTASGAAGPTGPALAPASTPSGRGGMGGMGFGFGRGRAKGGLVSKPTPKPKRNKRNNNRMGLAVPK